MELPLTLHLVLFILSVQVYKTSSVDTCGVAPNGDYICAHRTTEWYQQFEAQDACQQNGAQLLEVYDESIQTFVDTQILVEPGDSGQAFWIGLKLISGTYKWEISGAALTYDKWSSSSPANAECVIQINGEWYDTICGGDTQTFICHTRGDPPTTISPTTTNEITSLETSSSEQTSTTVMTSTKAVQTSTSELTSTQGLTSTPVETSTLELTSTPVETSTSELTSTPVETSTPKVTSTSVETSTLAFTSTAEFTTTSAVTSTSVLTSTSELTSTLALTTASALTSPIVEETTVVTPTENIMTSQQGTTTEETLSTSATVEVTSDDVTTTTQSHQKMTTTESPVTSQPLTTGMTVEDTTSRVKPSTTTEEDIATSTVPLTTTEEDITTSVLPPTTTEKDITSSGLPSTTTDKDTTTIVLPSTKSEADITTSVQPTTTTRDDITTSSQPPTVTEKDITTMVTRELTSTVLPYTTKSDGVTTLRSHHSMGTTEHMSSRPQATTADSAWGTQTDKDFSKLPDQSTSRDTNTQTINTKENVEDSTLLAKSNVEFLIEDKDASEESCDSELTLEKMLQNATLDDVIKLVENETLCSTDVLQLEGWFEENAFITGDVDDIDLYVKGFLNLFNKLLASPTEYTFAVANPAVFAEACNSLLEDFANKSSSNVTSISHSNIATNVVRQSADTFQGFTSSFFDDLEDENLGGYIAIQNDWIEEYHETGNSTITIITIFYETSEVNEFGNNNTSVIVSSLVSLTVLVDGMSTSLPVTFGLELDLRKVQDCGENVGICFKMQPFCVFWDTASGNSGGIWNTYGCNMTSKNETYVQCRCNHTTNFAILMQTTEIEIDEKHDEVLSTLSLVGLSISTVALLITLIVLVCLSSLKSDRVFVHKHLVVALLIAQLLFISTTGAFHHELVCKLVAIFLHYFYLAVFMWMLIEGVHLYLEIVKVFSCFDGKNKTMYYIVSGWGLPSIVVGVSVAIRWESYGTNQTCWLSVSDGLIWAFLGPVIFVILTNFIILLMVVRVVFRASSSRGKDESEFKHFAAAVKGALFLLPLLGLSWAVGFMTVIEGTLIFQYTFVILNTLQGLFIFLIYCAMNKEVRSAISRNCSRIILESEISGAKSISLRTMAKLSIVKRATGGTSPVLKIDSSSGTLELPSINSETHAGEGVRRSESLSTRGIRIQGKLSSSSRETPEMSDENHSPFSPDYD